MLIYAYAQISIFIERTAVKPSLSFLLLSYIFFSMWMFYAYAQISIFVENEFLSELELFLHYFFMQKFFRSYDFHVFLNVKSFSDE